MSSSVNLCYLILIVGERIFSIGKEQNGSMNVRPSTYKSYNFNNTLHSQDTSHSWGGASAFRSGIEYQYSTIQPRTEISSRQNNAIAGSEEIPVLSDDANLAHLADSVKTESEALTRKRESTLLNSALRVELHREASFYLSTMDGILEGGKHFLPGKYYLQHLPWIMYTQLLL